MTARDTPSQDRAIGRLEGKLDALIASQLLMADQVNTLSHTPDKIDQLAKRVASIEPIAAEFSRWRERGIGALMLISIISAGIGAAISAIWAKFMGLFS